MTTKVTRTTEGLRDSLFNEMDSFLNGDTDSEHAATLCKLSETILRSVTRDIEASRLLESINKGRDKPNTIADLNLNLLLSKDTQTGKV